MTEAHEPNDLDGPHEGPIKTPKQLILAVLYAFVVPIFGIVLLVVFVTSDQRPGAGSDAFTPAVVGARIRPVGVVEVKDATDVASMKSGEQVFAAQCTACHTAGALGAPKLGDAGAWAPRLLTGYEALLHSSLAGKGQMPAQGGGDFSDFEIGRAVVYMANKGGGKFAEPALPAAAAAASAPATPVAALPAVAASAPRADANAGTPAVVVAAAATGTAPAPAGAATGAAATPALYTQVCAVCHAAGIAGAPKLGDKVAWAPRIAQGIDTLTASVIKGKGAMPPKGGSNAPDGDIRAVVTWMVNASK
ncbi:MAG: c-type cytochrome [Caldimonas sp.]